VPGEEREAGMGLGCWGRGVCKEGKGRERRGEEHDWGRGAYDYT